MSRRFQFSFEPMGEFTLDDFRRMMTQVAKLSPLNKIMSLIPGMGTPKDTAADADAERDLRRLRGMIDSMTPEERRNPSRRIDASRRRRIAAGSGVDPREIYQLVKQFEGMADLMRSMRRYPPESG